MIQKRTTRTAVIAIAALVLSAVVGYRLGRHHPTTAVSDDPGSVDFPQAGCVDFRSALRHSGENGCVEGRVLRVYTARSGSTFFDFCQDYHNCPFGSVIFASDRSRFGNVGSLEGRRVQIAGEITTYHGRAEIIIRDPKQIRVPQ